MKKNKSSQKESSFHGVMILHNMVLHTYLTYLLKTNTNLLICNIMTIDECYICICIQFTIRNPLKNRKLKWLSCFEFNAILITPISEWLAEVCFLYIKQVPCELTDIWYIKFDYRWRIWKKRLRLYVVHSASKPTHQFGLYLRPFWPDSICGYLRHLCCVSGSWGFYNNRLDYLQNVPRLNLLRCIYVGSDNNYLVVFKLDAESRCL